MANYAALQAEVEGEILLPNTPEYAQRRVSIFNLDVAGHPAAIACPKTAADVVKIVNFARENKVDLGVTCGGHGTKAMVSNAIMLFLREHMNRVEVDVDARLVSAEGGCLLRQVDTACAPHDLAIATGTYGGTGVGGLTLVGGLGWQAKRHGFAADNIVSLDIVTSDGRLVTATDDNEHADLLWANRGGGGNFGVVVKFVFKAHHMPKRVLFGELVHFAPTLSSKINIISNMMSLSQNLSADSTLIMAMPCRAPVIPILATHLGEDGVKGIKHVPELQPATKLGGWFKLKNHWEAISFQTGVQTKLDPIVLPGHYYQHTVQLDEMNPKTIEVIAQFTHAQCPNKESIVLTMVFSEECLARHASKRPLRGYKYWVVIDGAWNPKDKMGREKTKAWVTEFVEALGTTTKVHELAYPTGETTDADEVYGDNLPRLREIKKKYDAINMFHHNRNIKPAK